MMDWNDGWGVGSWIVMSLMMVLFWGGLIALVVFLVRANTHQRHPTTKGPPEPDADQLLADRYARGEIDEAEFTRRRDVLNTDRTESSETGDQSSRGTGGDRELPRRRPT